MHRTDVVASWRSAVVRPWGAGVAGGVVGGLGMGVILHAGANLMPFIGALYGWPTVVGGWVAHMVNSVLIGLVFVVLVSPPLFRDEMATVPGAIAAGVLYAAAVGLVTTGIMLPVAVNLRGAETLPQSLFPLPGVAGGVLAVVSVGVAHLVYGVLLGATYAVVHDRARGRTGPVG